jgi:hypothetical protein
MTENNPLPSVDETYLIKILSDLLNIPSPTGFVDELSDL